MIVAMFNKLLGDKVEIYENEIGDTPVDWIEYLLLRRRYTALAIGPTGARTVLGYGATADLAEQRARRKILRMSPVRTFTISGKE